MVFGLAERCEDDGPALVDPAAGLELSHSALNRAVQAAAADLSAPQKHLVMIALAPTVERVVRYLAAHLAGHAVMPVPPDLPLPALARLLDLYTPETVIGLALPPECGYRRRDDVTWGRSEPVAAARSIHPDLALVLSTSGSTGNPKAARLSRNAISINAGQIIRALAITAKERAPTSLPLAYTYGLSVLHSHLAAGAAVILTMESVASRDLWRIMAEGGATSFAGVPASYQMLRRLDLDALAPAGLATLTQAGGALAPELIRHFQAFARRRGGQMVVMYGQTEATARIAVLPPAELEAHFGAAGRAVPGGEIAIVDQAGRPVASGQSGRIVYRGANVMMGYAQTRADLARGDDLAGLLDTGDLGRLDSSGMLWITGRDSRFAKLDGRRLSLDEIEQAAQGFGPAAVIETASGLAVAVVTTAPPAPALRREFAARFGLHSSQIGWHEVAELPLGDSGKIDYRALADRLGGKAP